MKQEEAAPNKEEAVKTIPDSELDDSAVEVVEVSFFKGVEYDSRTGLPWGMTQEQFDTNNAASRDSLYSLMQHHACLYSAYLSLMF